MGRFDFLHGLNNPAPMAPGVVSRQSRPLAALGVAIVIISAGCDALPAALHDLGEEIHSISAIADHVHIDPAMVHPLVVAVATQAKARAATMQGAFSEGDRELALEVGCQVLDYEAVGDGIPDEQSLQNYLQEKLKSPPQHAAQAILDFAAAIKADNVGMAAYIAAISAVCGFN